MVFLEQLFSAVILGPKWSNRKFVYLFRPSTIGRGNNTGKDRSVVTVNRNVDLYRERASP